MKNGKVGKKRAVEWKGQRKITLQCLQSFFNTLELLKKMQRISLHVFCLFKNRHGK